MPRSDRLPLQHGLHASLSTGIITRRSYKWFPAPGFGSVRFLSVAAAEAWARDTFMRAATAWPATTTAHYRSRLVGGHRAVSLAEAMAKRGGEATTAGSERGEAEVWAAGIGEQASAAPSPPQDVAPPPAAAFLPAVEGTLTPSCYVAAQGAPGPAPPATVARFAAPSGPLAAVNGPVIDAATVRLQPRVVRERALFCVEIPGRA